MLLVPCPDGHITITQPAHGGMTGQIARAWGNELTGTVKPWADVMLAAEQHDLGWEGWERAPTLNPATGLPYTFDTMPAGEHMTIHSASLERLAADSPYAALLVALHHASLTKRSKLPERLSRRGRGAAAHRGAVQHLRREVRRTPGASDEEIERNVRLLRAWDGISLHLIGGKFPRVRRDVPIADGVVDLTVARDGDSFTVDPWPFASELVVVSTEGRLLRGTFSDETAMRRELAVAPRVDLRYELRPTRPPSSAAAARRRSS